MPLTRDPSFASRTRPTKLASAPTSARSRVSASSSRPVSKSSCWTRTRGKLASRDRWKERNLIAGTHGRGRARHLLVHRYAPWAPGREGLGPARVARTQLVDEGRDGGIAGRKRELLARDAEALAKAGEVEQ